MYDELNAYPFMKKLGLRDLANIGQLGEAVEKIENPSQKATAKKTLYKILDLAKKEKLKLKKMSKIKKRKGRIFNAFITFRTINARKLFQKALISSPFSRIYLRCFKSKNAYDIRVVNGSVVKVETPSQPINIIWKNIEYTRSNLILRRIFSWIFTFVLFILRIAIQF